MNTIDITPIVNAALALIGAGVSVFLIPWLKKQTTEAQRKELTAWVKIGVAAAEQLYVGQGRGEVISIHALREEGDHFPTSRPYGGLQFLSTPSARRATLSVPVANRGINDFYPRPPRGW